MIVPLARIRGLIVNERVLFVAGNITANVVLLLRSYVTLQALDYRELGLATLLQTLILLLGMMQFGVLTGGFRLLCSAEEEEARRINNFVYTFLLAATAIGSIFAAVYSANSSDELAALVAGLGVVGGVSTLTRSWLTSQMMARLQYGRINALNLISAAASFGALMFIPINPLLACLAAVVIPSLSFTALGWIWERNLLPNQLMLSRAIAGAVLRAGFVNFMTGVFLQLCLQMERWYVLGELSLESLGRLYLVTVFMNLFQIIPTLLDQLFMPYLVKARSTGNIAAFSRQMRQSILIYAVYCTSCLIAVFVLAAPITKLIIPQYEPDLVFVYLLTPGLLLMTVTKPQALVFTVALRFRYLFATYVAATAATALAFAVALSMQFVLSLEQVTVVRSAAYALIGLGVLYGWWIVSRDVPGARAGFPLLGRQG